ncbi:MAG: proton-conducting membrane transporter [Deltaproteobacteria bacterium]|nr:MAG: proton-conducting membrane transporter [Deltaproteobacteria bacterium]
MPELHALLVGTAVAAPVVAFAMLATLIWGRDSVSERAVVDITRFAFFVSLVASLSLMTWSFLGAHSFLVDLGPWFEVGSHSFRITFLLDRLSTSLMTLTTGAATLIGYFSRTYLHGERGHPRFYLLLNVFAAGMLILVSAGSLDFLFVGWEIVGLTSALLIAFFHERSDPVRNGLRAFITYRICDVGLLTGTIMLHHFAHNANFQPELGPGHWVAGTAHLDTGAATLVALLFLLGAMGKSAQLPFGGWLPRAMEGPTPSSAIFYGALSVHAGVYLLIRLTPLLEDAPLASAAVIAVGAVTTVLGTLTGRVQTDVKSALAYATMTQIGLMFVEVGLHLPGLATVHLLSHATLRIWQLLRAPAILHEMHSLQGALDHEFETGRWLDNIERKFKGPLGAFLYQRALDRFYFDDIGDRFVVAPILWTAQRFAWLEARLVSAKSSGGVRRGPETVSDRQLEKVS